MTRPSVYELFGSKDALVTATVEDAAEALTTRLEGAFADDDAPWRDAMRDTFTSLFDLVESDPDVLTVLFLAEHSAAIPSASGFPGARRRVIDEITERSRTRWSQLGVEIGVANELLSLMLFSMGEALARRQVADGLDKDAIVELLTAFTNGGMLALFADDYALLRAMGANRSAEPVRPPA